MHSKYIEFVFAKYAPNKTGKTEVQSLNIIPSNPANPTEQGTCIISPGNSPSNYYLAFERLTD